MAAPAAAQVAIPPLTQNLDEDPSEAARFRLGALRFTPSIQISNVGTDTNVFNEFENPKRDTTAAAGPAVDYWLRLGRSRLSGRSTGQYLYFRQYDNQRAWNTANELRWEVPLGRFTPFVGGSHSNTRNRPGYEIDSRARLKLSNVGGGARLRLSRKTELVLSGSRAQFRFDENDTFLGVDLASFLDRRTDTQSAQLRTRLTPLTTFVVRADAMQDRFDVAVDRNADSFTILPGFELRPQALISGAVFVGVRRYNGLREQLPDFTGVVASVDASYTLRATRFDFRVNRDLVYSYQVQQPYFALTDVGLTLTQRITSKWDIMGRGGRQTLAYRNAVTTEALAQRTDYSWQGGAGLGYRLAPTLRLGVDAIYIRRQSNALAFRNFEGLRAGASVSYGLPQ